MVYAIHWSNSGTVSNIIWCAGSITSLVPAISCNGKCRHVCLFYESIETGWIETVCFTYIPKLNPVSDSKPKPVSTNGSRPKWNQTENLSGKRLKTD